MEKHWSCVLLGSMYIPQGCFFSVVNVENTAEKAVETFLKLTQHWNERCSVMCFTKLKITARMTTSFKQIMWHYINQLPLNSWGPWRRFWSPQPRGWSWALGRTHCAPFDPHTVTPQPACCQTLGFLITLYSVRDPGSPNPARQMQNSLAEAALTGAIGEVLGNLRDRTNNGWCWSAASVCPGVEDGTGHWTAVCHRGQLIDP